MSNPTAGSLFSGAGGFDLGFEAAGFEVAWQVEIDRDCVSVLERQWPDVRRYGDVCSVTGSPRLCKRHGSRLDSAKTSLNISPGMGKSVTIRTENDPVLDGVLPPGALGDDVVGIAGGFGPPTPHASVPVPAAKGFHPRPFVGIDAPLRDDVRASFVPGVKGPGKTDVLSGGPTTGISSEATLMSGDPEAGAALPVDRRQTVAAAARAETRRDDLCRPVLVPVEIGAGLPVLSKSGDQGAAPASAVNIVHEEIVPLSPGAVDEYSCTCLAPVDVIIGGFPCQDLSVAGKRRGLTGSRSGLFWEFVRIAGEMREATGGRYPTQLVLENVPGLLSSGVSRANPGGDFAEVLAGLGQLGTAVAWRILDARFFGVPQRRRRVFIVADFAELGVGERRAAEVLSLFPSGSRHPAACREAGEGLAGDVEDGAGEPRSAVAFDALNHTSGDVMDTLRSSTGGGVHDRLVGVEDGAGVVGCFRENYESIRATDVAPSITAQHGLSPSQNAGGCMVTVGWKESQSGTRVSETAGTLDANYGSRRHNGDAVVAGVSVPLTPGAHPGSYNGQDASNGLLIPVAAEGGNRTSGPLDVATACNAHGGPHGRQDFESDTFIVANSVTSSAGHHGHSSPRGDGSDNLVTHSLTVRSGATEDGTGRGTPRVACPPVATWDERNVTSAANRTRVEYGSPANTLHAEGLSVVTPMAVRRLTPRECERLQGWPDDHSRWRANGDEISDGPRYRMIGNGVAAPVAAWVARRMRAVLETSGGRDGE